MSRNAALVTALKQCFTDSIDRARRTFIEEGPSPAYSPQIAAYVLRFGEDFPRFTGWNSWFTTEEELWGIQAWEVDHLENCKHALERNMVHITAVRCWEIELLFPEVGQNSVDTSKPRLPSSLQDERFLLFATRERLEKVGVFFAPCPRRTRHWSWRKHIECHRALDSCDYIKVFEITSEGISDEAAEGKKGPDPGGKAPTIKQDSRKFVDVTWFFNPTGSQENCYLCPVAPTGKGCVRCTSAGVDCLLHYQNHPDQKAAGQHACTTCIISRIDDCSFQIGSKPSPVALAIGPVVEASAQLAEARSRTNSEERDYRSTIPDSQASQDSIIYNETKLLLEHPSVDFDIRSEGTKKSRKQSLQGYGSKSNPIILESDLETEDGSKFYE